MEILNSFLGQGMVAQIGEIVLFANTVTKEKHHDQREGISCSTGKRKPNWKTSKISSARTQLKRTGKEGKMICHARWSGPEDMSLTINSVNL